jgi:hypothetical protein
MRKNMDELNKTFSVSDVSITDVISNSYWLTKGNFPTKVLASANIFYSRERQFNQHSPLGAQQLMPFINDNRIQVFKNLFCVSN